MLHSFRTMLGRLQELWQKIKPQPFWLGVFALMIVGVFLVVEPSFAQEGVATGVGDWLIRQVAKIMLVVASLAIGLAIFFLRFFIMIASYNNYIDVSVVQLGWVMVRDVANMFFVVALLLIAFGTILGLEEYEWKKNLAKLVLSAILINFSNLIAQLCIDIAHIFTITFLNAISATAGGNLINMFKLDQILQLTAAQDPGGLDIEVLAAVLPAMLFAIMAAAAIGSYVVVMAARVVALWALIVISPLAFILGVIPQTKSYADKWWAEFSKYVIVAPIMVFFLWLSFATIGLGSIATEIEAELPATVRTAGAEAQFGIQRLSMSKVTSWENMANFLIAFAFLMYGIKATQETGVVGSGMIGSAVDFGKKVATIASGYAAGRWLMDKGKSGVLESAKWTGDALIGDKLEIIGNKLKKIPEGYKNWRSAGPQIERDEQALTEEKLLDQKYELTEADKKAGFALEKRADGLYKVQGLNEVEQAKGYSIVETKDEKTGKVSRSKVYEGYKKNIKTDAAGNVVYKKDANGNYIIDNNGKRVAEGSDKPLYESKIQGLVNRRYQKLLTSRKVLEKVQNDTKLNEEMMDKSIEAQPTHWLGTKNPAQTKDFDRIKRGMLAAMEARSSAKTKEFSTLGEKIVMGSKRFKDGKFQTERGTIAEQIAEHEAKSGQRQSELDKITKAARERILGTSVGKKAFEGKIKADLEVKAIDANVSKLESGLTTSVTTDAVTAADAANAALKEYREKFDKADNLTPEEKFEKQGKILSEMMSKGLIDKDEYDQITRNQEINKAMEKYSGEPDKESALNKLVAEGLISEKEKEKYSKSMGSSRSLTGVFPEEKVNVVQRTIAAEKEAHLEAEKLSTLQKTEEQKFAESDHGQHEAEEIARLKERTAAAEAVIKQVDETGKAKMAETNPEFIAARAAKIAAEKAAHTESQKVSTSEKEAEKAYTESGHGVEELKVEEKLKERTAAAEAEIKNLTARAKLGVQTEADFIKSQKERIEAEQATASIEARAQTFEKDRAADIAGTDEGKARLMAEQRAKEQTAAAEARLKQTTSEARADLASTGDPEFIKAQQARIAADKQDNAAKAESDAIEKELVQKFYETDPKAARVLKQEAGFKARQKLSTDTVSAIEEKAGTDYYGTSEGNKILQDQNLQAVIKKDAADLLKEINNKILEKKYYQALSLLTPAKDEEQANKIVEDLSNSSSVEDREMSAYLKALKSSQQIKTSEGDSAMAKEEAEAKADEVFVELSQKGFSVPSLSAANRAKRDSAELAKAGDQGRAQYLASNLAHLLGKIATGKPIEQSMKNGAYSTIVATANGANIDDAVGAIEVLANLTEAELRAKSSTERTGIEELKKFAEEMGIITQNAEGKYEGQNNAFTQSVIAQFQTSGADIDLVRANKDIGEFMEKNKIEDYAVGAQKFFDETADQEVVKKKSRYATTIGSAAQLNERYESKQNVLIDAQDELQRAGVNSGHFQMVGALKRDDKTGLVRFTTKAESGALQTQQKVKNEGTKVAPQALGNLNTATGHVDIDGDQFETSNVASLNNLVTFVAKTQDRTRRIVYGQTGGTKGKLRDGRVVLGDSKKSLTERGSGDYDTGLIKMFKSFVNEVKSNPMVIALGASSDLGHTQRFDAEAGIINGVIDGWKDEKGKDVIIDGTDDLINKIQKYVVQQKNSLVKLDEQILSETNAVKKRLLEGRKKEILEISALVNNQETHAKLEGAKSTVEKLIKALNTSEGRANRAKDKKDDNNPVG